ncbi:hypothetical protein Hdeb2414_s0003g00114671 [Helianthus debilis subsp. tardiflorus]
MLQAAITRPRSPTFPEIHGDRRKPCRSSRRHNGVRDGALASVNRSCSFFWNSPIFTRALFRESPNAATIKETPSLSFKTLASLSLGRPADHHTWWRCSAAEEESRRERWRTGDRLSARERERERERADDRWRREW